MTTPAHVDALHTLSDRELIAETRRLAERERHATAHVIAALMELDARNNVFSGGWFGPLDQLSRMAPRTDNSGRTELLVSCAA